jgi:hypothetical protein
MSHISAGEIWTTWGAIKHLAQEIREGRQQDCWSYRKAARAIENRLCQIEGEGRELANLKGATTGLGFGPLLECLRHYQREDLDTRAL